MGKKNKEDDTFLSKITGDNVMSVDGKETVFPVKLKLQEEQFE